MLILNVRVKEIYSTPRSYLADGTCRPILWGPKCRREGSRWQLLVDRHP